MQAFRHHYTVLEASIIQPKINRLGTANVDKGGRVNKRVLTSLKVSASDLTLKGFRDRIESGMCEFRAS